MGFMIRRNSAAAFLLLGLATVLISVVTAVRNARTAADQQRPPTPHHRLASLSDLPLYFIQNGGQLDAAVDYHLPGRNRDVYFTSQGVTFSLARQEPTQAAVTPGQPPNLHPARWESRTQPETVVQGWAVKLDFVGADPGTHPVGREEASAVISYFKGGLDADNTAGLSTYENLLYEDLWPGINLEYAVASHQLKYTLTVEPDGDPRDIKWGVRGADAVINDSGQLTLSTPLGSFVTDAPYVYQQRGARRIDVAAGYTLEQDDSGTPQTVMFHLGPYDPKLPLIIDPITPIYAGYVGGDDTDDALDIAVDAAGNAYITGRTRSLGGTFPVEGGPDTSFNGDQDAFVAKLDPTGTQLLYAGYIGGTDNEEAFGITLDADRNVYIVGDSNSVNFPATVGPDLTFNGGERDAFVAKIRADGAALVYAGFIGGDANDRGIGIEVLPDGTAIVAGSTDSTETTFPALGGPDLSHNGADDTFLAKVRPDGTALVSSGFIGAEGFDIAQDVAVDLDGNAYIIGSTGSVTFPVVIGPDLTYNGGARDVFIFKIGADDMAIDYAGYIGGSQDDQGLAIDVDERGYAYFAGNTESTEVDGFPLAVGPDLTHNGDLDVFVGALNAEGTEFIFSGYIGGEALDFTSHLALDGQRAVWLSGGTRSVDFPALNGFDDSFNGGPLDGYAAKVAPDGSALIAATFIGGDGFDTVGSVAVDRFDNAYISGATASTQDTFPVLVGPDLIHNGGTDGFVMKLDCQVSHEISGVFDAAGFQPLISPGSIVAVGGLFTEETATSASVPLSFDLNGFSVTFNDIPGALFGVFDGPFDQANVQAPWNLDVSSGEVEVKVHWDEEGEDSDFWSAPFEVDAALASPGIYMFPPGTTQAIVTNFKLSEEDDVIADSWAQAPGSVDPVVGQPAAIGGVVTIWCNGLGPVTPVPPTGDIPPPGIVPLTDKIVRVFIGGQEAQVLGAVLQPTSVGLNQINAFVPEGVEPGDAVPIVIEVDCGEVNVFRSRDDVTIAVRPRP